MKNTLKKLTAVILCLCLLGGPQVYACSGEGAVDMPAILDIFTDFAERLISVFIGSTNEEADIEFTMTQGEIFEAKKYFSDSHASTIAKMPDGNLISAFFAGPQEGDKDVRIWYSIHNGEGWSEPEQLASPDPVAHWNPVVINYGSYIRLYYKVGMEIPHWVTKYCDSFDCGKTWTEPQELVPGDTSGGRGPVKNKLIVTSKGTIIAPASTEQGAWRAFFDISNAALRTALTSLSESERKRSTASATEATASAVLLSLRSTTTTPSFFSCSAAHTPKPANVVVMVGTENAIDSSGVYPQGS